MIFCASASRASARDDSFASIAVYRLSSVAEPLASAAVDASRVSVPKVPTLALADGTVLYGSQTVVEYLDSLSKGKNLYPKAGPARWDALRRLVHSQRILHRMVQGGLENQKPATPHASLDELRSAQAELGQQIKGLEAFAVRIDGVVQFNLAARAVSESSGPTDHQ